MPVANETQGEDRAAVLKAAQRRARKLMQALEIKRVIVVDDHAEPTPEIFIATYRSQRRKAKLPDNIAWEDLDEEEFAQEVRTWWRDGLTRNERRQQNRKALGNRSTDTAVGELESIYLLLGQETQLLVPEEWPEKLETVKADAASTLVLFDLNLGVGQPQGGAELLREYLTQVPEGRAGILTDQVEPGEELARVTEFTKGDPSLAPRTMITSKNHIINRDFASFLERLRVTACQPQLRKIRDSFLNAQLVHAEKAREELESVHLRELEDIVFRSANHDGTWELETLERLLGLLITRHARAEWLAGGPDGVPALISKVRPLIQLEAQAHEPSHNKAAQLMAAEQWIPGEYINGMGFPLANGDVFEIGGVRYVLLVQPCDITLRSDGSRKASSATLLRLVSKHTLTGGPEGQPTENRRIYHDLPSVPLEIATTDLAVVFSRWLEVQGFALDLCSFSVDGRAAFGPEVCHPDPLTEGSKRRRDSVSKEVKRKLELVARVSRLKHHTPELARQRSQIMATLLQVDAQGTIKPELGTVTKESLEFGLARIGRLSPEYAAAALTALTTERARAAFDHSLDEFDPDD